MKPRSLTPLWRIPRSSRRSTAWRNVAFETLKARWCTQPGSVGVRSGVASRASMVKIGISRPSPGSKYRWLSASLSRLGCSKTNGIPSTPSQKSIDVRRSAPTRVMWWTPWACSFRTVLTLPAARVPQNTHVLCVSVRSPFRRRGVVGPQEASPATPSEGKQQMRKSWIRALAVAGAVAVVAAMGAGSASAQSSSLNREVGVLTRSVGTLSAIAATNEASCSENVPRVGFPNGVGRQPNPFARVNLFPSIPSIPLEPNVPTSTFNVRRSTSFSEGTIVRIPSTPVTTPTRFMVQCPFTMSDATNVATQVVTNRQPSSGGVKFLDGTSQIELGVAGPFHFLLTCNVGGATQASLDVFSTVPSASLDGQLVPGANQPVNILRVNDSQANQPGTVNPNPQPGGFNQSHSASSSTELAPDGSEVDIFYNLGVGGLGHRCFGGYTGQKAP